MIAWDWVKSKSKDERHVMIRCAQNARLIIALSYFVSVSSVIVLIVTTTLDQSLRYATNITDDTKKLLPVQGYYIYDTSASPQFELTFLVQCVSLLIVTFSYTSTDNLLGLLVFHICGQLKNLTGRLYRMRESKDFVMMLKINVLDHIRLIRSHIGRVPTVCVQLTVFAPYITDTSTRQLSSRPCCALRLISQSSLIIEQSIRNLCVYLVFALA
jgi:hypothetical protein